MGGAGEGEGKVGKGKAVQKGWREEWEGRAGKGEAQGEIGGGREEGEMLEG